MPKIIQPDEDEWYGVQDAKKRKQIQDRLAQRARRLRLAKSYKNHPTPPSGPAKTPSPYSSQELVSLSPGKNQFSNKRAYQFSTRGPDTPSPEPTLSQDHSLTIPMFTVFSALYHNGVILGIPCVTAAIARSRPALPHVPAPLRPLQIQLDQVHFSFIDRMPDKTLRRNMIMLSNDFNTEDLIADVFNKPSFIIEPGCQSWDPTGWSVAPEFRKKWTILFDYGPSSPSSLESPDSQS